MSNYTTKTGAGETAAHDLRDTVMDLIDKRHGRTGTRAWRNVCHYGMTYTNWLPEWTEVDKAIVSDTWETQCNLTKLYIKLV